MPCLCVFQCEISKQFCFNQREVISIYKYKVMLFLYRNYLSFALNTLFLTYLKWFKIQRKFSSTTLRIFFVLDHLRVNCHSDALQATLLYKKHSITTKFKNLSLRFSYHFILKLFSNFTNCPNSVLYRKMVPFKIICWIQFLYLHNLHECKAFPQSFPDFHDLTTFEDYRPGKFCKMSLNLGFLMFYS